MRISLTRQEILNLNAGLNAVGNLGGAKFSYAIARNQSAVQTEIAAIKKAYEANKDYLSFQDQRDQLIKSYTVVVDGKPQTTIENGVEVFVLTDKEKYESELNALKEKYKLAINDFEELLMGQTKLDLYSIPPEYLPENITPNQLNGILAIVKEA